MVENTQEVMTIGEPPTPPSPGFERDAGSGEDHTQAQLLERELQHAEKPSSLSPWDQVQLARNTDRPHTLDSIHLMCQNFFELRGDRRYADDPAIIGGLATFFDIDV